MSSLEIIVKAVDRASAVMSGIGNKVGTLEKRISGAGGRMKAATGKLSAGFQKMGPIAQGASMMGGAAMMGFAAKSVQASAQVDKGVHQILTLMDDAGMSSDKLSDRMMDMSTKYGQSADVMSKSMYDVVSAGYQGEDAFKVLETAAKGAAAGNTDVTTSGDALTSMLNAYGLSASEVESVNDKLFKTIKLGKTTMGELGGSIGRVASTASSMGVSMEEMLGPIANLTAKGFSTEEAITSVNQAMIGMVAPTAGAAKAAKDLGLEFTDASGNLRPMADIMGEIASKDLTPAQMQLIFPNIRASKAVIALSQSHEKLGKSIAEIADSAGAGDKAFKEMEKSSAFMLEKARAEFFKTMKELGDALIPVIASLLPIFTGLLGLFNKLPKPIKMVVGVIGVLLGALAMLAPIIVPLISLLGGGALTGAITAFGTALLAALGPIGLIIIAIGLLVAAFAFDWGGIRTKTAAGMKKIWNAITHPIETLKKVIAKFGDYFLLLLGPIGLVVLGIKHWDKIKKVVTEIGTALKEKFLGGLKAIGEKIGPVTEKVTSALSNRWKQAGEVAKTAISSIGDRLGIDTQMWEGTVDSATGVIQSLLKGRFKEAAAGVFETLSGLTSSLYDTFSQLAPGVQERLGNFKEVIVEKLGAVKEFFISLAPKFLEWARKMISNLIAGIKEKIELPKKIIKEKMTAALEWIKKLPALLRKAGEEAIQNFIDGIKAKIGGVGTAIKGIAQKIRDYLPFSPAKEGPLSEEPDWQDYLDMPSEIDMPSIQAPEIQGAFNAEDCVIDPRCLDEARMDLADQKPFEVPIEPVAAEMTGIGDIVAPTVEVQKSTKKLIGLLDQLSYMSGVSTEKLEQGMTDLVSSGKTANEAYRIVREGAIAAKLANADFSTSMETLSISTTIYGKSGVKAANINAKIINTARRTEQSVDSISKAFQGISPVAEAAGLSVDETIAALEVLIKKGAPVEDSAELLAASLAGIVNPGEEAILAAERLGFSFVDATDNAKSLVDIVNDLSASDLGAEDIEALFPDKKAASGIKYLITTEKELKNTIGGVSKSSTISNATFKGMQKAQKGVAEETKGLKGALLRFTNATPGPIKTLYHHLSKLPTPLLLMLGPIGQVTASFKRLKASIQEGGTVETLIIDKLGGAVSVVKDLIRGDTESIKNALSTNLESGAEQAKLAIDSLGTKINIDTEKWKGDVDNATAGINLLIQGRFKEAAVVAKNAFGGIAAKVLDTLSSIIIGIGSKLPFVGDSFEAEFEKVTEWLKELPKKFKASGRKIVEGLIKGMTSKVPYLDKITGSLADTIAGYFPFSPAKEGPLSKEPDWDSYLKMPSHINMPAVTLPRVSEPLIIEKCVIAKDALSKAFETVAEKVGSVVDDLKWLSDASEGMGSAVRGAFDMAFVGGSEKAKKGVGSVKDSLETGVDKWIEYIANAGSTIETMVYNKFVGAADGAKAAFAGTTETILSGLTRAKAGATDAGIAIQEGLTKRFVSFGVIANGILNGVKSGIYETFGASVEFAKLGIGVISTAFETHANKWLLSVTAATEAITKNVGTSLTGVAESGIGYLTSLKTKGIALFEALRIGAMSSIGNLGAGVVNAIQTGIDGINALQNLFYKAGRALVNSMIDGLNSLKSTLKKTVKGLMSTVDDYLPHSAAKLGPLSKLPDWSSYLDIPKIAVDTSGLSKILGGAMGSGSEGMSIHIDNVTLGEGYRYDDFIRDMELKRKQRG